MELKVSFVKIIFFLVIIAVFMSGCVIDDGERDYAMSHITPSDTQSSLIITTTIPIPSTPTPHSLYWIKIDPISDKQKGDIFTITATTNLSVGDDILIQVYRPPDMMQAKSDEPNKFRGAQGTTKVIVGNNGNNTISFVVNSSEFYPVPDEYVVIEVAKNETVTGFTFFNIFPKKTR